MNSTLLKLTALLLILAGIASSCNPEEPEIKYTLSSTSLNFDATGGEAEFTVSFKSPAVVESIDVLDTWCQVSTSGVSPVSVTVTVAPNTINEVRNTSVVVNMKSGETKAAATVEITQESACIFDNPLTDLPWLKEFVNNCLPYMYTNIFQCTYNDDIVGFFIEPCNNCTAYSALLHSCDGTILSNFLYETLSLPAFFEKWNIKNRELIWTNYLKK